MASEDRRDLVCMGCKASDGRKDLVFIGCSASDGRKGRVCIGCRTLFCFRTLDLLERCLLAVVTVSVSLSEVSGVGLLTVNFFSLSFATTTLAFTSSLAELSLSLVLLDNRLSPGNASCL